MGRPELSVRLHAQTLVAEAKQEAVGLALVAGQPGVLEAAAAELQAAIAALTQTVEAVKREGPIAPAVRQRLVEMSQRIALHREACLRRGAVVERALLSVLPAAPSGPVYAAGTSPYSRAARQSGAFKVLSA